MKLLSIRTILFLIIFVSLALIIPVGLFAGSTNTVLAKQIKAKILLNKNISIDNLEVTDEGNGEVKLDGTADLYGEVYLAVREAAEFNTQMINTNIEVIPKETKSDAQIEKEVRAELNKHTKEVDLKDVDVTVEDSVVRLIGTTTQKDAVNEIFKKIIWIPGITYARNEVKEKK
ncbi:MAG: hypothetical protein A2Y62_19585 [Candidatus Fischerbacteria bacterium RBG_13_37_8]|uniref:BON domain-containing protein n=1 Tax=Candidatus Fischerbacteria bacterium RBG_13_37_8 TaxID=1817863 RepID=A0A1F5VXN6_9BACT|nr:MAG: hypothetical protein A2Y62_19585 [Candidatus Fischerbacteria bacterium RBG_13_37_8]